MIFQAMPEMAGEGYTGQGHWYCCPNGHIYTVGECGGAVVESQCPECGAIIGGGGHQLRNDNAVAQDFLGLVGDLDEYLRPRDGLVPRHEMDQYGW